MCVWIIEYVRLVSNMLYGIACISYLVSLSYPVATQLPLLVCSQGGRLPSCSPACSGKSQG